MPSVIYTAFEDLLLKLFLGSGTAPKTLYMGLMAGQSEIAGGGYARQMVTGTEKSGVITFATVTFPAFTVVPSPNGATSWFVADAPLGGNTFFSGPLNPAPVTGKLTADTGNNVVTIPTSLAAGLMQGDVLMFGSACANNLEYASLSSIYSHDSTNTEFLAYGLFHVHPSGEAFSRDGATRVYTVGFVETVAASISLVPG